MLPRGLRDGTGRGRVRLLLNREASRGFAAWFLRMEPLGAGALALSLGVAPVMNCETGCLRCLPAAAPEGMQIFALQIETALIRQW